jgi:beta-phosphoglucomutase-like phosphatase (HAD superfamily)
VILDIDGTLLHSFDDDDRLYREAVSRVLGRVRFREMSEYEHVSDSGILAEVFRDNAIQPVPEAIEAIRRTFFSALERHVAEHGPFAEIPGARAFVQRLKRSPRHACAIATGSWRPSALIKLRTAGFDIDRLPLATSDEAVTRSDILRRALAGLKGPIRSITYYGDGIWDRKACASLGWQFRCVGPALGGITSFDAEVGP